MICQAWWHTAIIPALERLRQEHGKFKAVLGYIARLSQKQTKTPKNSIPFLSSQAHNTVFRKDSS
jgi:hypothetical protein